MYLQSMRIELDFIKIHPLIMGIVLLACVFKYTDINGNTKVGYLRPKKEERQDVVSENPKVMHGNIYLV